MTTDPIVIALIVAVLWGISQVVHRFVLPSISTQFVMLISAIVYMSCVGIYVVFFCKDIVIEDIKYNIAYVPIIAVTTFVGLFLANLLYLHAVKHANNINTVSVVMGLYPIITLVAAAIILKEGLSGLSLLGFFIALIGMTLMIYNEYALH